MNKPKWQRARFIIHTPPEALIYEPDMPDVYHYEMWVTGTPYYQNLAGTHNGTDPLLLSNVSWSGELEQRPVNLTCVELLARGPEDFADDVPLITWEQWLKESAPEKPA